LILREILPIEFQKDNAALENASVVGHAELAKFREKNGYGRAIAAPQFGYNIRLICMIMDDVQYTLFNPVIRSRSPSTWLVWDDCFSIPDSMVCVRRHLNVALEFRDSNGNSHLINLDQKMSELIQHEMDHLDGVLMTDVATPPVYGECAEQVCPSIISRSQWLNNKDKYSRQISADQEKAEL
jgi:peptide deformylase